VRGVQSHECGKAQDASRECRRFTIRDWAKHENMARKTDSVMTDEPNNNTT